MNANVGKIDRALRIGGGLALLSLLYVLDGDARWWGFVGIVPLITGLIGWCPVYPLLGINTCPVARAR